MSGFRARNADRDRYVDIIESAYVDGQLGDEDRELRVSRALTAETQRVVVRAASDGQALLTIHVRNGIGASARLETTLQGSRVRAVPYDG